MSQQIILFVVVIVLAGIFAAKKLPGARWMILSLIAIIAIGTLAMEAIEKGPALLLKPISDSRIAFISKDNDHSNVWTMRIDGTDLKRVTDEDADYRAVSWSPLGTELASVCSKKGSAYQLILSAWNGTYSHPATTSAGTKDWPVWSRDSRNILFICSGKVFQYDCQSGEEAQKIPSPSSANTGLITDLASYPFAYADYSSDRKFVLCEQETDDGRVAYAIESQDGDLDPETMGTLKPMLAIVGRSADASWSPVSNSFAVAFLNRDGINGLSIADMSAMSKSDLFTTKGDKTGAQKPAWSPDGEKIAYELWTVKDGSAGQCIGICTIDATGGKPHQVVSGDAREPSWSSDGKYIVYTYPGSDGKRDIWRANADGSGAINLTKGRGDNSYPVCSPVIRKKS